MKKPTRWMSNAQCILDALHKRCPGRHGWCKQGSVWKKHRPCYGEVAKAAAIYPFKMCRAILEGLVEEMKQRGRVHGAANLVLPAPHTLDCSEQYEEEDGWPELAKAVLSVASSPAKACMWTPPPGRLCARTW